MTDYKYSGVWVDPNSTSDVLVLMDQMELQLIVLALDWAVEKSESKTGAQTNRLKQLSARMRELHHQRVDMVNQLQKVKESKPINLLEQRATLAALLEQRPELFEEIELEDYCSAGGLNSLDEDLLTEGGELSWITVENEDGDQLLTYRFRWSDVEAFGIRPDD